MLDFDPYEELERHRLRLGGLAERLQPDLTRRIGPNVANLQLFGHFHAMILPVEDDHVTLFMQDNAARVGALKVLPQHGVLAIHAGFSRGPATRLLHMALLVPPEISLAATVVGRNAVLESDVYHPLAEIRASGGGVGKVNAWALHARAYDAKTTIAATVGGGDVTVSPKTRPRPPFWAPSATCMSHPARRVHPW